MKYYTVPIWVHKELGLTGNEALMYSLIYTATHDGKSYFYGSLDFMSKALNINIATTKRVMNKLVEKELINKKNVRKGKEYTNNYYTVNLTKTKNINQDFKMPLPVREPKKSKLDEYNSFQQNEYDYEQLEKDLTKYT